MTANVNERCCCLWLAVSRNLVTWTSLTLTVMIAITAGSSVASSAVLTAMV